MGTPLPAFFADHQRRVETTLDRLLPAADAEPAAVHRSMRYTVLAPSKRVRAALAILAAELCGRSSDTTLAVAAAVEVVHAASLILDDLPSMDNAPLRRGRPANHIEFGEAIAVLAAFALLNLAFATIGRACGPPLGRRLT